MNARDIATCYEFAASQEVLDTESALLVALGYRLGGPTAHTCVELLPSAVAAVAVLLEVVAGAFGEEEQEL